MKTTTVDLTAKDVLQEVAKELDVPYEKLHDAYLRALRTLGILRPLAARKRPRRPWSR